jgi:predicted esterase
MKRLLSLLLPVAAALTSLHAATGGQDLHLTFHSAIDDTEQPYRLYVPGKYDGQMPLPLVVALHGTGGNEATLFEKYGDGRIKSVAEKYGVFVVSPFARGVTEHRGIGENDILCVLAEVQKNYRIDPDRIYCTGHSMGGTGSAYLALHHPELFAAVAPLAAAYSFPWLAKNAQHIPFWWLLGGKDYPPYLVGVHAGADLMIQMGQPTKIDILEGKGHGDWVADKFDDVFAWFLEHRRQAHRREYTFVADTPLHGEAYSTSIDRIAHPGRIASVTVQIGTDSRIKIRTDNVATLAVFPDPTLLNPENGFRVDLNGDPVFDGRLAANEELDLEYAPAGWKAAARPRRDRNLRQWHIHPVGTAPAEIPIEGTESPLGNWVTDAMREATGADLALFNRRYYRGLPIPKGTIDIIDVIQAVRPFDQYLVTTELTGAAVRKIIEDNILEPVTNIIEDRLVQVSGMRYSFDRRKPKDQRIVSCDLDPARNYKVVLEGQVPERETMNLAGEFGKLTYQITDAPFSAALYAHAVAQGRIAAPREGRVQEVAAAQ